MSGNKLTDTVCFDNCQAKTATRELSCKLTTEDLRRRKETVLASLKTHVKERKELSNGFAFRFDGSNEILDELNEFIKTERECCDFFTFGLSVSGDKSEVWLNLTGPDGAKDFIQSELGM